MEVHLADNSSVISHHIVYLPMQFADGAIHPVKFLVLSALYHAIILGTPFLYTFNPIIDRKTYTIT